MNDTTRLAEKIKKAFQNWLAPLVNLENTLLLLITFVFHQHYFGDQPVIADFIAMTGMSVGIYIYGAIILLASLFKPPDDWQEFLAFMVFLGSTLIAMSYSSFFWISETRPSWQELLAETYYVLQGVFALIQVILLLLQEKGQRFFVNPRLGSIPGPLKTLAILSYVIGATLLLDRGFSVVPNVVTAQVNLLGVFLLEGITRIARLQLS